MKTAWNKNIDHKLLETYTQTDGRTARHLFQAATCIPHWGLSFGHRMCRSSPAHSHGQGSMMPASVPKPETWTPVLTSLCTWRCASHGTSSKTATAKGGCRCESHLWFSIWDAEAEELLWVWSQLELQSETLWGKIKRATSPPLISGFHFLRCLK